MKAFKRVLLAGTTALLAAAVLAAGTASALVAPVTVGPPHPTKINLLDFNGFFPSTTKIRVGDSVSFQFNGFHTVAFLSGAPEPPLIIVDPTKPLSGKVDSAAASFWFDGQPTQIVNPAVAFPTGGNEYNGTGVVSSGLPNSEGPTPPFVVKFTKAGTFTFDCLVHPGMKGVVKVVASGPVPSAKIDKARAKAQEAKGIVQALKLRAVNPGKNRVLAGNDGKGTVAWLRFFPKKLHIKAGTTVEFHIASQREVHTITIGPAAYLTQIANTFITPEGGGEGPPTLVVNPLAGYPSDPPPLPAATGANHGNGFVNSGILSNAGPPLPSSVKIDFTKPGTYEFQCMIHPEMHGKIVVTK